MHETIDTNKPKPDLLAALSPCYGCSNPNGGCQEGCPTNLPLPDIKRLVIDNGIPGLYAGATLSINRNPLGAVCVEACDPCEAEEHCRNRLSTVPLQALHAAVTRHFFENMDSFVFSEPTPNGKKVAIVGDGPSALSAAIKLAASGTFVVIYSESGDIGGLARYISRVDELSLQDTMRLVQKFDKFITIEQKRVVASDLSDSFDGIIVASGLKYEVPRDSEGNLHCGMHAVKFVMQNQGSADLTLKGQRVMIVGGGKTAVDAALLAKRLGAEVEVIYRRDLGSMDDLQPLINSGIPISSLLDPEVSGQSLEHELFVRFRKMEVGGEPKDGKRPVGTTPLSETRRANIVLWATSGEAQLDSDYGQLEVPVVVAGDLKTKKRTVAHAVKSGLDSASDIMSRLGIDEKPILRSPEVDTSAEFITGRKTRTPFMVAAVPTSDAANIESCRAALRQEGCSGIVIKTVTFDDIKINFPAHYMQGVRSGGALSGMGNADHISRSGITKALETARTLKSEFPDKIVIISIMSGSIKGWGTLAKMIKEAGLDGVECSFSCPQGNLDEEGIIAQGESYGGMLGQNITQAVAAAKEMVAAVGTEFPVSIKIPTSNTPFVRVAEALYEQAGIRYITCANSIHGLVSGLNDGEEIFYPSHDGIAASVGYTGEGITPASLASVRTLAELKKRYPDLKIWGTGGMMSGRDAIAMLAAGADGVQFGTALIERGVSVFEEALSVLRWYCHLYGKKAMDIINSLGGRLDFDQLVEESPRLMAVHNPETCVNCGNCATTCNEGMHGAVKILDDPLKGKVYETEAEKCEGCGACAELCPVGAIQMRKKES